MQKLHDCLCVLEGGELAIETQVIVHQEFEKTKKRLARYWLKQ